MESSLENIFHTYTDKAFAQKALSVFHFQYVQNPVYREYCQRIHVREDDVLTVEQIPFLPISFFKTHDVKTTDFQPELTFQSSGTTGMTHSHHYIKDKRLYEDSIWHSFHHFYGDPVDYVFLTLLPNYLEQQNSSLIYMMDFLMKKSNHPDNGYYLRNHKDLYDKLLHLQKTGQKTILWGVTFALLDFIEEYRMNFPELIVFETGGMKGRRKEMVKEEVYALLEDAFGVSQIHSEYGMCELLSQAYSCKANRFFTPPWMKLWLRDEKDPLASQSPVKSGVINVIDLANLYSCSFISTEELGRRHEDGSIEVLGRLDSAQLRGCNLLVF